MLSRFFDSKLFQGLEKVVDAIIIGLFVTIGCIPIFTIGTSITAGYYTMHKVIYQGRGYTREYWTSFKDNFKQCTLSWLIFMAVGAVLGGDIYICRNVLTGNDKLINFQFLFVLLLLMLVIWAIYHFTYIARFENGFKASFKVSGALAILHFAYSIGLLLITGLFALFCYLMPVFIMFVPTLYLVAIHPIMEKVFRRYMSEEDLELENERLGRYDNKED